MERERERGRGIIRYERVYAVCESTSLLLARDAPTHLAQEVVVQKPLRAEQLNIGKT